METMRIKKRKSEINTPEKIESNTTVEEIFIQENIETLKTNKEEEKEENSEKVETTKNENNSNEPNVKEPETNKKQFTILTKIKEVTGINLQVEIWVR